MRAFWDEFSKAVDQTKDLKISDVIAALDEDLGPHFFPPREDGTDPRGCARPAATGRLGLKLGRLRQFHRLFELPGLPVHAPPGDRYRRGRRRDAEGRHARARRAIRRPARRSPSGAARMACMCSAASRPRTRKSAQTHHAAARHGWRQLTLEQALGLLSLPRIVGMHPETQEPIEAGIGRFGPYVRMGAVSHSLDRDDNVLAIGMNRAVDLLAKSWPASARSARIPKANRWRCARAGSGRMCSTARGWPTCRAGRRWRTSRWRRRWRCWPRRARC